MNILLYDPESYTQRDLIFYLEKEGCQCKNILYKLKNIYHDVFFEYRFRQYLAECAWDCVMSTNFFPIVARLCYECGIKYLAWVYDSPIDSEKIEYYQYPTSYIFLFDRIETEIIRAKGGIHIFHLPLAAVPHNSFLSTLSAEDYQKYSADVSFVGQFYESPLNQLMLCQDEYDQGFIDAIIQTQLRVYGYNFIEEMITEDLVTRLNKRLSEINPDTTNLTLRGLISSVNKQVTHTEREVLCNLLGQQYKMNYYSPNQLTSLRHLNYGGCAYYYTEMPKIFYLSKLNLNPTLRSIQSGIPLRALDILSCQGTLLSNYQPELSEYFSDGEDVIIYESLEDALCKAEYYIKHDEHRREIAQNGYQKLCEHFSYPDRISTMFKTAGLI